MNSKTTRRKLLGGAAATASAALAGCSGMTPFVGQQLAHTETVSSDDVERLSVDTTSGEITVTGGDHDEIGVDVEKQSSSIRTDLEDLTLQTEQTDGTLELRSEWDGSLGWFESQPSMNLEIDLPREIELEEIRTSVGRVTVADVTGDLEVDTSTGRVTARDIDGDLEVDTTTGRVDITDVDGAVGADTTTGRVEIRDVELLEDVSTTTGRIETDVPAIDGDTEITASTGRIEAAISPDVDAELSVRTNTGRLEIDDLELTDATRGDDLVTGTLGDGGPELRFETSTGRITLTTLE
ncbi:DUF4097 family beta strand repeat-containing protein [Natronobacterium texcoconense]|uniref:Putative adhesin n=1 Tax=Natronobacterium texcoconense TaxID=1095778 RepID=A0A1H1FJT1_NATTX|nr:DUF4097 family beta strand repeat-containing protein [Natronobacterium texcoconense]SDR01175.1 Putative adhesin [Natronobacterium texcoconense]